MMITINQKEVQGFIAKSPGLSLNVSAGEIWVTLANCQKDLLVSAGNGILLRPDQKVVVESVSSQATYCLEPAQAQPLPRLPYSASRRRTHCA